MIEVQIMNEFRQHFGHSFMLSVSIYVLMAFYFVQRFFSSLYQLVFVISHHFIHEFLSHNSIIIRILKKYRESHDTGQLC